MGRLSSGMLVGSADTHMMLMVMMVEPASLGSMSIRKGECGVVWGRGAARRVLRLAALRIRYSFHSRVGVGALGASWSS